LLRPGSACSGRGRRRAVAMEILLGLGLRA
jgi:hypothetical protein